MVLEISMIDRKNEPIDQTKVGQKRKELVVVSYKKNYIENFQNMFLSIKLVIDGIDIDLTLNQL